MRATLFRPALLLCAILLGGCTQLATQPSSSIAVPINLPHTTLSTRVSETLSQNMGYTIVQTDETHWGQQIELDVAPIYYSATGQICREMTVKQLNSAFNEKVIACQYGQNWGVIRNVTQALGQQGL